MAYSHAFNVYSIYYKPEGLNLSANVLRYAYQS
jgi:hypothetical protein